MRSYLLLGAVATAEGFIVGAGPAVPLPASSLAPAAVCRQPQMNIGDRFVRLVKSNVNEVLRYWATVPHVQWSNLAAEYETLHI